MECKLNKDSELTLTVDVFQLIHDLPADRHLELAESLSCSDTVINHVMDQVLEGYTENGFCGSWSTCYDEPLQKYRQRIAEHSSDTAAKEIEILKQRLERSETSRKEIEDKYYGRIRHEN